MSEADFDVTEHAFQETGGNARFVGDQRLYVRFFQHPRRNEVKSQEAGRPIFEDAEYIEIRIPGDKDNIVVRPVRPLDRSRFRERYLKFRQGIEDVVEGMPLEMWPVVTRAQAEELKFFNIRTVEQLAEVSDGLAQKFIGIHELKRKAKTYVEAAAGNAPLEKMEVALKERDNDLDVLRRANEELAKRLAALEVDAQAHQEIQKSPKAK